MASSKPRLNLYLDPSMDALLGRLAAVRSMTKPAIVIDLLAAFQPQLEKLATMMEAAQRAPEDVKQRFASILEAATTELQPLASELIEAGDRLQLNLEDAINDAVTRTKQQYADEQRSPPTL